MPQGSSTVRPTNGLYLLPFILYIIQHFTSVTKSFTFFNVQSVWGQECHKASAVQGLPGGTVHIQSHGEDM